MARLIDADALNWGRCPAEGRLVRAWLDEAPTVDAVPVVHGRKAESAISKTGLMCTACYSDIDRDAVFCKYCGAKMDLEVP